VNERRGEGVRLLVFLALVLFAKLPADAATPAKPKPSHQRNCLMPLDSCSSPAPARGVLPDRTIYRLARWAGWSPDAAVMATAVALAESGGRPRAHNPVPPDDSYCLMQVNMLDRLGPARRATYHLARNEDLYDPPTCMRVARGIYLAAGGSWRPWTTFTRGTYRSYLARARAAGRG
jgi:hypothetical protein